MAHGPRHYQVASSGILGKVVLSGIETTGIRCFTGQFARTFSQVLVRKSHRRDAKKPRASPTRLLQIILAKLSYSERPTRTFEHRSAGFIPGQGKERRSRKARERSSCPDRHSIAASFLDDQSRTVENSVSQDLLRARSEIWKGDRLVHLEGRYDPGQNVVTFAQDDRLSLREPGLEFAGIAKLAHVDFWHDLNVTQNVAQIQMERILGNGQV